MSILVVSDKVPKIRVDVGEGTIDLLTIESK